MVPTFTSIPFEKVTLDIAGMAKLLVDGVSYSHIVEARHDYTPWVEATSISSTTSFAVASFLFEYIISRLDCFRVLLMDNGAKNSENILQALIEQFGIAHIHTTSYEM